MIRRLIIAALAIRHDGGGERRAGVGPRDAGGDDAGERGVAGVRAARGSSCGSTSRSRPRSAGCASPTPAAARCSRARRSIRAATATALAVRLPAGSRRRATRDVPRRLGGLAPGVGRLHVRRRRRRAAVRPARPRAGGRRHGGRVQRRASDPVRGDLAGARRARASCSSRGCRPIRALATPGAPWREAVGRLRSPGPALLLAAAAAGTASASLAVALQGATAAGTSLWSSLGDAPEVLSTRFGTVWGLGALAWLAVFTIVDGNDAVVPVLRPATVGATGVALGGTGVWLRAAAVPLLALALVPGLSGHAAVRQPVALSLPANVLHVTGRRGLDRRARGARARAAGRRAATAGAGAQRAAGRRAHALLHARARRRRRAARRRGGAVAAGARRARRPARHRVRPCRCGQARPRPRPAWRAARQPPPDRSPRSGARPPTGCPTSARAACCAARCAPSSPSASPRSRSPAPSPATSPARLAHADTWRARKPAPAPRPPTRHSLTGRASSADGNGGDSPKTRGRWRCSRPCSSLTRRPPASRSA